MNGKPTQNWRCPLHIDQDLKNVGQAQHAVPGQMGRRPRLRWPRKRNLVTPREFLAQNPTNNGLIDPILDPEEQELDYKTVEMNGLTYKIPEMEIKLDFIAKARHAFYMDHAIPQSQGKAATKFHSRAWTPDHARIRGHDAHNGSSDRQQAIAKDVPPTLDPMIQAQAEAEARLRQKSFVEQRTVLALLDLMKPTDQAGESGESDERSESSGSMGQLVNRLVADVPDDVAEQINLSEEQQLEKLMKLAQQRLDIVRSQSRQRRTEPEITTSKAVLKQAVKGAVNGNAQQAQINGTTLGHDHGDD